MRKVGIGSRTLNFLVDTAIISILTAIAFRTWEFYVYYYHIVYYPFYYFFALILFIYYVLFESISGRTPGKRLSMTKVVDAKKGTKPRFLQVLVRSLVRLTVIDCFFIPFLDKTLHDYLSGTDVVEI